jgi:hypothetical protein
VLNKSPFFGGCRPGNIMSAIFKKAKLIICNNVAVCNHRSDECGLVSSLKYSGLAEVASDSTWRG